MLLVVLAVYAATHCTSGAADVEARALTFTTLVIANLGLILTNRSWPHSIWRTLTTRNPALWWVIGGASGFLLLALTLPFLREVFHFAPVPPYQLALSCAAGLGSVLWFEIYKLARSG